LNFVQKKKYIKSTENPCCVDFHPRHVVGCGESEKNNLISGKRPISTGKFCPISTNDNRAGIPGETINSLGPINTAIAF
jgi:hypothetical protein